MHDSVNRIVGYFVLVLRAVSFKGFIITVSLYFRTTGNRSFVFQTAHIIPDYPIFENRRVEKPGNRLGSSCQTQANEK
ncbi:hypothetical protein D3C71_665050 [compost metagenome]